MVLRLGPQEGEIVKIGDEMPMSYGVTAIIHTPVEPESVTEYGPPYATIVVVPLTMEDVK